MARVCQATWAIGSGISASQGWSAPRPSKKRSEGTASSTSWPLGDGFICLKVWSNCSTAFRSHWMTGADACRSAPKRPPSRITASHSCAVAITARRSSHCLSKVR